MSTPHTEKFEISVSYNGVSKPVTVNPNQSIQAVLQRALNAFGIRENRQNFGLFRADGTEVTGSSAQGAGLDEGSELLLRPRRVSGGE